MRKTCNGGDGVLSMPVPVGVQLREIAKKVYDEAASALMKPGLLKVYGLISVVVLLFTLISTAGASWMIFYQPKVPKHMRKNV